MTIEGRYGYITLGCNEGDIDLHRLKLTLKITYRRIELEDLNPFNRGQESYCSNGTTVYWGGLDPYSTNKRQAGSYLALRLVMIPSKFLKRGSSYTPPSGNTAFPSLYGNINHRRGTITGMAVQR
jgi:hypothetical protein